MVCDAVDALLGVALPEQGDGRAPFRFTDRMARERAEEQLAPAAARSVASRGRAHPEPEDPLRTAFERDRDRILHAKAFRRLKHKTQVFLNPDGDHSSPGSPTRCRSPRSPARWPGRWGSTRPSPRRSRWPTTSGTRRSGTWARRRSSPTSPGGWHHAAQGVRIFEVLEHLNLTWEVRDGIRAHSWKIDPPPATREGDCVRYADRIGYLSHDALDAIRAGVLRARATCPPAPAPSSATPAARWWAR